MKQTIQKPLSFFLFILMLCCSVTLNAQLSGTKTIGGTSSDYASIKAAFKDLNTQGVAAPGVTFLIRTGTYNEDSLRVRTATAGPTAPIVIRPDSAATVVINVTPPSSVYNFGIAIDSTHNVTFTGQPYKGALTDRNLSVNSLGTNGLIGVRVTGNSDNCVLENLVVSVASKTSSNARALYAYATGSSVIGNPDFIVINNNLIKRAYTAIRVQGFDPPYFLKGAQVSNNEIATGAQDSIGAIGITVSSVENSKVYNNTVRNILPPSSGGASTVYGISVEGYTQSTKVYRNTIAQIRAGAAATNAYGLYVSNNLNAALATPEVSGNRYFNNLVYDIDALTSGTGSIAGIFVANSYGYDSLYHNSVLLTGTSSGQRTSAAFYYNAGNNASLMLRNNNLVNRRIEAGGANSFAAGLYMGSTNSTTLNSDFNNVYPGTGSDTNYCAVVWKISTGYYRKFPTLTGSQYEFNNDHNSVAENAPYVSLTDLRLTSASTSKLESAGVSVLPDAGFDYDGVARNATTPDIGAFEASMTAVDGMPPVFSMFTPLLPAPREGARTLSITIKDRSGLSGAANAPKLMWKKSTDVSFTSVAAGSVVNGVHTFSIPEQSVRTIVQYYFTAQDAAPGANFSTLPPLGTTVAAPPALFSYLVQDPISGVKTVGGLSPDYATIKAAIKDINAQDVVSPGVTLLIRNGIYNEDSLRIYTKKSNTAAPIVIRPDSAATVVINVTPPSTTYNFAFAIDSTQSVTISGQPLHGSDTARNMTINSLGTNGLVGVRVAGYSPNAVVRNLIISTGAVLTNSSGRGVHVTYGIINSVYGLPHNALVENNYIQKAYTGIHVVGANNTNAVLGARVRNNSIGTGASDVIGAFGIDLAYSDSLIVEKNIVRNVIVPTGGSSNSYGIRVGTECNWALVSANDISKIRGIATTGTTAGLYIGNTQTKGASRYINNSISDVEGLAAGTGNTGGIYVVNTNTTMPDTMLHNSVLLTGTSTGARISAALAFIPFGTGYQLYLRNNSFVNRRNEVIGLNSFAAGLYIGLNPQIVISDNNNFYGGVPVDSSHLVAVVKMNSSTPAYYKKFKTLGGWQYEFKNDFNSVSENPPHVSASDLRLQASTPSHLESNGTPVGVSKDILGVARNATTPDIGAFEGTNTPIDSMPPVFTHQPLPPAPTTGARMVQVTITDPSGIAAGSSTIWHKIKDSVNYVSVAADSIKGTTHYFTLPGRSNGTIIQYYFSAKDGAPSQNFATWPPMGTSNTPPSALFSYLVQSPLAAGTYTVGVGKDFPTLDSFAVKISKDGVGGAVTAILTDTLYALTKLTTFSGPINGTTSSQRLVIKPEAGKKVAITSNLAYAINLLNASNVTIDGINNGGSSLYINTTGSVGIQVEGNSDGNIIQNVKFRSSSYSISFLTADAAMTPDNNLIKNNNFTRANIGVLLMNVSNNAPYIAKNNRISGNVFDYTYQTFSDSLFNTAAIWISNAAGTWIDNNYINNIYNSVTIGRPNGITLINDVRDTRIFNNVISRITHPNSYDVSGAFGINVETKIGIPTHTVIYNNMITDIDDRTQGNGHGSVGIKARIGQTDTIAYNTVLMRDSTGFSSVAMYSTWSTDPNRSQVWLNNIGINLRRPFLKNAKSAAFMMDDSTTNVVSNNNNWFSLSDPNMYVAGYGNNSLYTSLSEWQKRGRDINSISVNANFKSPTDLHIDSSKATLIYSGGTPVPGIFTDIDGQIRHQFKPSIGADEFNGLISENDIGVTAVQRLVSTDTLKFRVLVRNFGASVQNSYSIKFAGDTTFLSGTVNSTRPLLVGGTDTLRIFWPKPTQGIHSLKVWTTLANDQDRSNDTLTANIFVSLGWSRNTSGIFNNFQSVKAVSDKAAWAVGDGTTIMKTTDGGNTWTSPGALGISANIYNIEAVNEYVALIGLNATGQPAQIFRTANGGINWTSVFSEAGGFINAIKMYSATAGYAFGDPVSKSFTVLKTTNAGMNWERTAVQPSRLTNLSQPEYGLNNSMCVFGQNYIWFGTTYGRVIFSTDGGATWDASQTPINGEIDRVIFNGPKFGVAGGLDALVRTTDGGLTWTPVTTGGSGYVLGLGNIGNTFWASQGQDVFVSFDLGKNWLTTYVGASDQIRDLSFIGGSNYQRGWGVGATGLIITYYSSWTGVDDQLMGIPTEFALQQNFPNPFNPSTTIKFALPTEAAVSIKIFDILGREVRSLLHEQTAAGYHKVEWNGRNNMNQHVASGMYIYRIEAGSFTATKKMMLLK